ncbi:MAG: universal stress protein [Nitrosarchaeum sp.]|nr:universal stress protein [Nitrosarchaeum sp.]
MSFNNIFALLQTILFKNILVPFDLSNKSFNAFKIALDMAKKYDSKITILTCIQLDTWHHKFYDSKADDQLLKKQKKTIISHIEKLENLANKSNISMKSQILRSVSVVKDITTYAKSRKFDLIVMGSYGRTGIDKLILGSVANGILQKSSCPVLIIK